MIVWAEVGRRLQIHLSTQEQSCDCDGFCHFETLGLRRIGHAGLGLSAKILHDYFLNMAVLPVNVADSEQTIDSLFAGLANADEDAGRKRNCQFTCFT